MEVSWTKHYNTWEEMEMASDLIIHGKVIDSITELRNNMVFTQQQILIKNVEKGNIEEGSIIEVLQTGGEYEDHITPEISETPLMQRDKEYILYLEQTEYDVRYGKYYLIAGGNQGLVSFDNIKTVREQNLSDKENINRVSATWEKKRLKYYIDSTVDSNYGMSIHYQIVYGAQSWSGLAENAPTKEIGS